jgi:cytochrome c biogenesis protein CcdA
MTLVQFNHLAQLLAGLILFVPAGAAIAYAVTDQRRKAKRPVYFIGGLIIIYLALIYFASYLGSTAYVLRSGLLTRAGVVALCFVLVAIVITDWRKV